MEILGKLSKQTCFECTTKAATFVVYAKYNRFTLPLGMPRGLKGLLHMLNTIVSLMTTNLCFLFLMCFSFLFH